MKTLNVSNLINLLTNFLPQEEEKAADDWERKMALVLASHEFGLLFEALAEGIKSRYASLYSACFVSATWLIQMLEVLPDTGIQGAARVCLLKRFVSIFKSAKDVEDKALSLLALSAFIHGPGTFQYPNEEMLFVTEFFVRLLLSMYLTVVTDKKKNVSYSSCQLM